jgi:hypothetical protein
VPIGNRRLKSSTCLLPCDHIWIGGNDDVNWQNSMRANDLTAIPTRPLHAGLPIAIALLSVLAIRSGSRRWRAFGMRWIVALTALLVGAGWLGYLLDVPIDGPIHQISMAQWRRTVDGWEKVAVRSNEVSMLTGRIASVVPGDIWDSHPHPIVLSLLLAMFSTLALVAFSPTGCVHCPSQGNS